MVTVFLHCWQRTEQHQENLQEQRCTTSARPALKPGPQHTSSQPSGASRDVPGRISKGEIIIFYAITDLSGKLEGLDCCFSMPYRYISFQQSLGYHCQGRDDRSLGKVQDTQGPWQQGVWSGGHGGAGPSWILFESTGPRTMNLKTSNLSIQAGK